MTHTSPRTLPHRNLPRATALTGLLLLAGAGCGSDPAPEPASAGRPVSPADDAGPGQNAEPQSPSVADPAAIETEYGALLAQVVTETGLVRYEILARPDHRAQLDRVVRGLGATPLPTTGAERLALWCNAYNANVLALALEESRKPGFESVVKVPGFFDGRTVLVAGERLTLNDLENTRVRPLGDPRIHAALVCAAMSCPPLRREPYTAARIDEQLGDQCQRWVNDPSKFRVTGGGLGLSEILKWYGEDFKAPPYGNEVGFTLAFADPGGAIARYVVNIDSPRVEWLTYDWALNQAPAGASGP